MSHNEEGCTTLTIEKERVMDKEQLIKDVIRWIITTKNTEMLDESDVDLVYKDYVTEQVVNVPQADSVQPQLADVRAGLQELLVGYNELLVEAINLYQHYPNNFRATAEEYFQSEINLWKKMSEHFG